MTCFFWGLGLVGSWAFLPPAYSLFTLWPCWHFPSIPLCYSCYNVAWLNPAGPLWACCLFPSQWLIVFTGPFLTLFTGSYVQFSSWASLAHLLSLGFLVPFPILLSHGPLLTLLSFPSLITLYFIFGSDGSFISPLLSLLTLLWACCGLFSLSIYCPWVCFFKTHFMSS